MNKNQFTPLYLKESFVLAIDCGYKIIKCEEYLSYKNSTDAKFLINRVDIDFNCTGAKKIAEMFNMIDIKGTFFIRLHACDYNPFSFKNYKSLDYIINSGHEIGLHSEIIDMAKFCGLNSSDALLRDISILNKSFEIEIKGVSSHNGCTGNNNLDFWNSYNVRDFGLLYEAYTNQNGFNLFNESVYITDSNYTYWKCYRRGVLDELDKRGLYDHIMDNNKLLYTLIHPVTYYGK